VIASATVGGRARLALLHYTAPPVTGGVESILSAQAGLLRDLGLDVRVVAGRGDADLVPELDSRHPEAERLTRRLEAGAIDLTEVRALQGRIAERLHPLLRDRDLAIVHNVLTMPFNLPFTAALVELGVPLLAWTHDLAWNDARYAGFRRQRWPYRLIGEAHAHVTYVAISEPRRQEMAAVLDLPLEAIAVVPNGIDPVEFAGISADTRLLLERAGALDADPLVLVPQRITPNKRLDLALDAASELIDRHPGLRIVVTGPVDPHDRSSLAYAERLLERRADLGLDRIVLFLFLMADEAGLHPVDMQEVAELYRLSDVVLIPSANEGFGLPLLEAAAARVPLVCADIQSFRDIGSMGLYRFPADPGPGAVASAIEGALSERGVQHRRRILRRYAWSAVRQSLEDAIAGALRRAGPTAS
jgi:mannosylglucosylglycerate synthase